MLLYRFIEEGEYIIYIILEKILQNIYYMEYVKVSSRSFLRNYRCDYLDNIVLLMNKSYVLTR